MNYISKKFVIILIAVSVFVYGIKNVSAQTAQTRQSSLFVPLIGITSVPEPLALPDGPGNVTYRYAVKNFLSELPLADVQVVDDKCGPVKFIGGDDNGNSWLDHTETWRYICVAIISETTQSISTATGIAVTADDDGIVATHKAYTTVVVGLNIPPPLVNIVNITKVAYPLALPREGGNITFTYRVNNPGVVPLSDVRVVDDKCNTMSNKLGDTDGNNLLNTNEVWIYTCTMPLKETTTNTATVTAFSNGFKAVGNTTITVKVETPYLPETGNAPSSPEAGFYFKIIVWAVLAGVLASLFTFFFLARKSRPDKNI